MYMKKCGVGIVYCSTPSTVVVVGFSVAGQVIATSPGAFCPVIDTTDDVEVGVSDVRH